MSVQITTAVNQPRETTTQMAVAAWIKALSVGTLLSLLGLAGGMLVWRRLAEALCKPLDAWTLAMTAFVLAVAGLAVRVLGHGYFGRGDSSRPWLAALVLFGPTTAFAAVGFSLNMPGTSTIGLATFWGILAAGEISSLIFCRFAAGDISRLTARMWRPAGALPGKIKSETSGAAVEHVLHDDAVREPETSVVEQAPLQPEAGVHAGVHAGVDAGVDADLVAATVDETPREEVTQQVIRLQGADGTETMSGWLRASFLPGQRTATVHLSFCPPFSSVPTVEIEQVDGPPGRIKTVQLLPYGVRFDLKLLKDAEEPLGVLLQFSARA